MLRFERPSQISIALVILLGLGACAGDPAAPVTDGLYTVVTCSGLNLGSPSGVTLDEIPIGVLPSSFQSPVAAVMFGDDGEPSGFAYVLPDDTDALRLSVPLHPTTPMAGGAVSLTFTDGTSACAPVDFTILPLPAADGEFEAVVDLLQAVVTAQATILETTREELNATALGDMPPAAWPLAMVQSLLDDPANAASLRAIADGAMGGEALDWLDRLLARTDLRASLESNPPAALGPLAAGPARFSADDLLCDPAYVGDAERLDYCMKLAAELARSATGLSRQVSEDIKRAFSALSDVGLPLAGEVKVIFGAMFWLIYSEREGAAAAYPSTFTSIDLTVDPDPIQEDDERPALVSATVVAGSLGYDMQAQILDGILQAKGLVETFGDFNFSTGTVLDDLASQLAPQFASRIRDADIESLQIPAQSTNPITLDDALWLDTRVVSGSAVEVVDGAHYEGRQSGTSLLSVRTKDGEFGGDQIAEQVEVSVSPLQVTIAPDEVFVGAGNPWEFLVTVAGSRYPQSVEIDPMVSLQGTASIAYNGDGTHTVSYTAPDTPIIGSPDLLTVRHTAETGARGYSDVERLDIATIRFGGVRIVTAPTCLDPGETLQLEAFVPGADNPDLIWSVTAGTIDSTGFFTAPAEAQIVQVTVEYADNPDVKDSIELQVGGCSCQATVRVGGQDSGSTRSARFFLSNDLSGVTQIDWAGGETGPTQSILNLSWFGEPEPVPGGTIPVGATGSYQVGTSAGVHVGSSWYNPDIVNDTIDNRLRVSIIENDGGNVLAGSVSGEVALLTGAAEPSVVSFSMTFHIEANPLLSTATTRVCRIE